MMKNNKTTTLLGAFLLLATGCVGTEVGNPETGKLTRPKSQSSLLPIKQQTQAALTLSTGIEVIEAWVVFDDMQFLESGSCSETENPEVEEEVESEDDPVGQELGPGVVELVSGQEFPALSEHDELRFLLPCKILDQPHGTALSCRPNHRLSWAKPRY